MSTGPIQLHTTPPIWRLPSNSPACAKLETWLRLAGVEYETPALDFPGAPKGKIPYILEGGRKMGDSTLIIEHFQETRGIDLDRSLSPREQAISLACRRMIKENLYWGVYASRYVVPENWAEYRKLPEAMLGDAPDEVKRQFADGIKQSIDTHAHGHGFGRHSFDEAALLCRQDLEALSTLLGDNTWFMGHDEPTTIDATIFGYVGNLIQQPYEDAISKHARAYPNLVALCDRVRERTFPEL